MATFMYQSDSAPPEVEAVLKSEPETAPIVSPSGSGLDGDDDDPVPTLMKLDGEAENNHLRVEALVKQAERIELSTLHGPGPYFEKEDSKHRIGELLVEAFDHYCEKFGAKAGGQRDFFKWFDELPELDRIMMLSKKIKSLGAQVHGRRGQEFSSTERFMPNEEKFKKMKDPGKYQNSNSAVVAERLMRPSVVKAFARGVKYLDLVTRPNYAVSFEGNMAKYRGRAFDTTAMQTVHSGKGFGIWVMDEAGVLYAGNHIYGQMHHSSFLAGNEVLSGGELRARNGKIELISGKSGHYCPPIRSLINALKVIEARGIDISAMRVLVWRASDGKPALVSGKNVVDNGALYEAWGGPLNATQKGALQEGKFDEFKS